MNKAITDCLQKLIKEEMEQNKELNINPIPLPGRKNGLSPENAYVVETYHEEINLINWLAGHADTGFLGRKIPSRYHREHDTAFIEKDDKIIERVIVTFFNEKGYLLRRANYYFDITSYYYYLYYLGVDKPVTKQKPT